MYMIWAFHLLKFLEIRQKHVWVASTYQPFHCQKSATFEGSLIALTGCISVPPRVLLQEHEEPRDMGHSRTCSRGSTVCPGTLQQQKLQRWHNEESPPQLLGVPAYPGKKYRLWTSHWKRTYTAYSREKIFFKSKVTSWELKGGNVYSQPHHNDKLAGEQTAEQCTVVCVKI